MKFDTKRALELADDFDFPREAGTDGERRAADLVADAFERAGLTVARQAVVGSRFPRLATPWLGWLGVGAWMTLGAAGRSPLHLLALAVGLGWFRVTAVYGFRFGWGLPPHRATANVAAWRAVATAPLVRVVFLTPLDALAPALTAAPWWTSVPLIAPLLTFLFIVNMNATPSSWRVPDGLRFALLGAIWMVLAARAWRSARRGTAPGDNRSGLAVLIELARSWPRGTSERIETRFVATGGQGLDCAGLRALVRAARTDWPRKPTLFVLLGAPGVGSGLDLAARRLRRLADSAAADLWVPHGLIRQPEALVAFWPFENEPKEFVCLIGENAFDASVPETIEPEALGRAAQLATEIALRWAKQVKTS